MQESASSYSYITTGDAVPTERGYLRGHGTFMRDDELCASVTGFVERVNKLVSVRPVHSRYIGEVGDVVVGRVLEVGDKRWKVDLNARQDAILMLSSIILPGAEQRRRTQSDELQMRTFFTENDLISAEIQKVMNDGSISLHTRSQKYGQLRNGQLVHVAAGLIKRSKQHFHSLTCGVDVILGCNGYIWISATPSDEKILTADDSTLAANSLKLEESKILQISAEVLENMARVRNSIIVLSRRHYPIDIVSITQVYEESLSLGLPAKTLLSPDLSTRLTQTVTARMTE